MFTSKSRPVPSKAALKILYQLAYISSGTAVGVAALCHEERRRRTQIVQRIADNARKIRQSPRYSHTAAAAAEAEEGIVGVGAAEWLPEYRGPAKDTRRRPRSIRASHDGAEADTAVRGPELPSMVESGYARTQHRSHQKASEPAPTIDAAAESQPDVSAGVPWVGPRHASRIRRIIHCNASTPGQHASAISRQHAPSTPRQPAPSTSRQHTPATARRPRLPGAIIPQVKVPETVSAAETAETSRLDVSAGVGVKAPRNAVRRMGGSALTTEPWRRAAEVSVQKDPHFRTNTAVNAYVRGDETYRYQPDKPLCVRCGVVGHAAFSCNARVALPIPERKFLVSLISYQALAHKALREAKLPTSVNAKLTSLDIGGNGGVRKKEGNLAERGGRSPVAKAAPTPGQPHLYGSPPQQANASLSTPIRHIEQNNTVLILNPEQKASRLRAEYTELIAHSKLHEAAELVQGYREQLETRDYRHILSQCLTAMLGAGMVYDFAKLLKIADGVLETGDLERQYGHFLQLCDAKSAHHLVMEFIGKERPFPRIAHVNLSPESREIVALAIAKHMNDRTSAGHSQEYQKKTLWAHLRKLPHALRGRVLECRHSLRLEALWRSTHDLKAVQKEADVSREFLAKNDLNEGTHPLALLALERSLLKIYVSANAFDAAIDILQRQRKADEFDAVSFGSAASLFAKKGAWEMLQRLIAMAERSGTKISDDVEATSRFNNAIQLYAASHTATETWKFVTAAVDAVGFTPNRATTGILLESFVSRNAVELISKWLQYTHRIGRKMEVDGRLATELLTRFYFDHRPSHVLIMWFCRNIAAKAPELHNQGFLVLVKEAIGYDIRMSEGDTRYSDGKRVRETALQRLKLLEGPVGDVMPAPWVVVGNKQFRVPEPASRNLRTEESVATGLAKADTRTESIDESFYDGRPTTTSHPTHLDRDTEAAVDLAPEDNDRIYFHDLRPTYSDHPPSTPAMSEEDEALQHVQGLPTDPAVGEEDEAPEHSPRHTTNKPQLHHDMVLALSLKDYDKVLALYRSSLDGVGLPFSPLTLEIVIESSLRHHEGDSTEAEALIHEAKTAGMNVSCAMGPLLIHRMKGMRMSEGRKPYDNLRTTVIDYYRSNEENGWPVTHHVGATAANLLINSRWADHGLNVLDAMYKSDWAKKKPLEITVWSVFLKGFVAKRSWHGVIWLVNQVLNRGVRLDRRFLSTIRKQVRLVKEDLAKAIRFGASGESGRVLLRVLLVCAQRCFMVRERQKMEATKLGKRLVAALVKCRRVSRERVDIDIDARLELEDAIFGARTGAVDLRTWKHSSSPPAADREEAESPPQRLTYLQRRVAGAFHAREHMGRRGRRADELKRYDIRWIRQYRDFLRQRLVLPDGKLATFGFHMVAHDFEPLGGRKQERKAAVSPELAPMSSLADVDGAEEKPGRSASDGGGEDEEWFVAPSPSSATKHTSAAPDPFRSEERRSGGPAVSPEPAPVSSPADIDGAEEKLGRSTSDGDAAEWFIAPPPSAAKTKRPPAPSPFEGQRY